MDPTGQSTDEDSYKALTALGILSALQSLVKATFNESNVSREWFVGVVHEDVVCCYMLSTFNFMPPGGN